MKYLCLSWNRKELNEKESFDFIYHKSRVKKKIMRISMKKILKRTLFLSIPSNFVGRTKFPIRILISKGIEINIL